MNNKVLQNISYGVYVITSLHDKTPTGCIANSLIQVSYDTIAVSINHNNYTNSCIRDSKKFAVSILSVESDNKIIGNFGFHSGRDYDKFQNIKSTTVDGLQIIEDSVGYLICDVIDEMETETHTLFLGKIIDGEMLHDKIPMTYAYYHAERKGSSPKNAPTYVKPTSEDSKNNEITYRCSVCNYIYHGDITKEPATYHCPICQQPKEKFIKIS